jgi:hypothetical protein
MGGLIDRLCRRQYRQAGSHARAINFIGNLEQLADDALSVDKHLPIVGNHRFT